MISTGTKALQEQLFFRDIPFLERVLERALRVCYMKGRSNYACRQKIYDAEGAPVLSGLEEVADFQIIQEWEKTNRIRGSGGDPHASRRQHGLGEDRCAVGAVRGIEVSRSMSDASSR